MTRFIVRRLLAMVVVMLIISIITFLLLAAIPNGNPAYRLAGRTATRKNGSCAVPSAYSWIWRMSEGTRLKVW